MSAAMTGEWARLAERLEAATGADRELEGRIQCAVKGVRFIAASKDYTGEMTQAEFKAPPKRTFFMTPPFARYTASVDAILALIAEQLPGWLWTVSAGTAAAATINDRTGRFILRGEAATPALALAAAFARAKASQEGT